LGINCKNLFSEVAIDNVKKNEGVITSSDGGRERPGDDKTHADRGVEKASIRCFDMIACQILAAHVVHLYSDRGLITGKKKSGE